MSAFPNHQQHGRAAACLKMHTRSAKRLHLTACGLEIAGRHGHGRGSYRAPSLTDPETLHVLGSSACAVCLNRLGLE